MLQETGKGTRSKPQRGLKLGSRRTFHSTLAPAVEYDTPVEYKRIGFDREDT